MLDLQLKNVKFLLTIAVILMVVGLIYGISSLKGNFYWNQKYFKMQWAYLKTKVEFFVEEKKSRNQAENSAIVAKHAGSVPILLYHGVIEDPNWKPDGVNISLEDFRRQMFALKIAGYETISTKDFLDFLAGRKNLPEKSFLLTFDDGRQDSFYPVDPILKALGYTAVMNVITGRSLAENNEWNHFHLTEDELKKMIKSGRWEIESHTQNGHDFVKIDAGGKQGHFLSNKLWLKYEGRLETDEEYEKRIRDDLAGAKKDLEKKLGVKVFFFAYPFGDFGSASENFPASREILTRVVKEIYPYSFYQARRHDFPANYPGKFYLLKRINVDSSMSTSELLALLKTSQAKDNNFQDHFENNQGWVAGWGSIDFQNGLMLARSTNSEDSSLAFLNGSFGWKNYFFQGRVKILAGRSFALVGRYQNGNNYISCDFDIDHAAVSQRTRDDEKILAENSLDLSYLKNREITVSLRANGNDIECLVEGKTIAKARVDSDFLNGGVGFKTWDERLNNSSLLVKEVRVEKIGSDFGSFRGAIARK